MSLSVSDPVKIRYMYGRYTVLILKSSVLGFCPVDHRYTSVIHQFPCVPCR